MKEKLSHRSEDSAREYYTKENVPIYQYIVQEPYFYKGANGLSFKMGSVKKIHYNPKNPEECYIEGESFIIFTILLRIGIIFTIVSILFLLLYQRLFTTFFIILLTLLI